ncbi:HAD family phosphatase [cf. Phormidesmis sp. LEGE 11477]|uniref:HAD family hydrolase n=1 Tax=cf. Phormidesmis sp. LEGE 11477 TaxID=1828680 RepID=UPI0018802825|nr:HAD family phosphatase [cf. Phormidesmis sp. LEGE 11477]MBE9062149.1 HAD family phosphatase [cf. Phormidesmis sp. LEGE 11477]
MTLKAALFSFNGVVINDEAIRQTLSNQLLLDENLRPDADDYKQVCLGRSDRACLKALLAQRGRTTSDEALDKMLAKKSTAYKQWLDSLDQLPLYPGLDDLIFRCRAADIKMAIVTGSQRQQVTDVLACTDWAEHFPIIVAGDDVAATASKPAPDAYQLVIERLNQLNPDLHLQPSECIAIEDSFAGIESAKRADIPVVGVAHTYPNHMLQRRSTWVVDYLREIKFDWIGELFGGPTVRAEEEPGGVKVEEVESTNEPNGSGESG